ncbi:phosphatidylinositol n-acetylglucosaminyltransferase subunit p [Anaeramoeba flamelloides]|uniref:Phosphatidylinositol n-acetylglucosaminyltransferase subunit p n=1 Tax=Anaeramoeba flamelloides TaxID=1746091 RepID=A0AAV7Y877_9EUKA|nr:phosphatidylinositol n-acetylglucosaminyltransferase subunit p [Anaeramoeba flamelloides]
MTDKSQEEILSSCFEIYKQQLNEQISDEDEKPMNENELLETHNIALSTAIRSLRQQTENSKLGFKILKKELTELACKKQDEETVGGHFYSILRSNRERSVKFCCEYLNQIFVNPEDKNYPIKIYLEETQDLPYSSEVLNRFLRIMKQRKRDESRARLEQNYEHEMELQKKKKNKKKKKSSSLPSSSALSEKGNLGDGEIENDSENNLNQNEENTTDQQEQEKEQEQEQEQKPKTLLSILNSQEKTKSSTERRHRSRGEGVKAGYGFALWIISWIAYGVYVLWALVPSHVYESLGVSYYPNQYWAIAIPVYIWVCALCVLFWEFALSLVQTKSLADYQCVTDSSAIFRDEENDQYNEIFRFEHSLPLIEDIPLQTVNKLLFDDKIKKVDSDEESD